MTVRWLYMDLMILSVVYLQAVSNKGKKVTVAVICLITERISSWIAFMDFSLGALEKPRYTILMNIHICIAQVKNIKTKSLLTSHHFYHRMWLNMKM